MYFKKFLLMSLIGIPVLLAMEKEILHQTKHNISIPDILAEREIKEYWGDKEIMYGETRENALKKEKELSNKRENMLKLIVNPEDEPLASIWGKINYAMSLDQMKQKLEEEFKQMYKEGKIITKKQFEGIKDKYFTKKGSRSIDRVWGALYLKEQFKKQGLENYDVPSYVIVVDDTAKNLEINVMWEDPLYPIVKDIKNTEIYFENVTGTPVGDAPIHKWILQPIGYDDFSNEGNIIYNEKTKKNYLVDTEIKSFDVRKLAPRNLGQLLNYAKRRFYYLNNIEVEDEAIFTIPFK